MFKLRLILLLILTTTALPARAKMIRLPGHIPHRVGQSKDLGRLDAQAALQLMVPLKVQNESELADLIRRQQSVGDPLFGQYLTSAQFDARFSPTNEDLVAVTQSLSQMGLTITDVPANRRYVMISATAAQVEAAFAVEMHQYRTAEGRTVYAANTNPQVDSTLSAKIHGIVGLDSFKQWQHQAVASANVGKGSGPNGGLSPADIHTAYGLNNITPNGSGQTLALFELDGYTPSDITAYASHFNLSINNPQNILVGGYSGGITSADGQSEVTLDIEMVLATAPGVQVLVYEGPNTSAGYLALFNRIASDNSAKQVSTSWGLAESNLTSADLATEKTVLMQMAAQGQSFFAASGDAGAFADSSQANTLMVQDPAAQPYVTAVGGTTLTFSLLGQQYGSEKAWGNSMGGSGGGVSFYQTLPIYQQGLQTTANSGSTSMRMVPDVALNADPNTGYSVYVAGAFQTFGGTSAAAPIWAGFAAIVNQQRTTNGQAALGFFNTLLYRISLSSVGAGVFHDITTGNNFYYNATTGYDLATGLGTLNAPNLFNILTSATLPPAVPGNLAAQRGTL